MGNCAWYYNAGNGIYYWTESYTMSVTQFAIEITNLTGKNINASDISVARRQSELDSVKYRARTLIYIS